MKNTNDEIKKVSYDVYLESARKMQNELRTFAEKLFPENGFRYVEIYSDFNCWKPINAQVNWSAIGAVPADDAIKFAKLLMKAAELAQNFKYNGYKVYYPNEE